MEEMKKSRNKLYVVLIFSVILLIVIGAIVIDNISDKAEKNLFACEGRISNLFKEYGEYDESYSEHLDSCLEILERDLESAEKYKFFMNSEEIAKLERYRKFYDSFPTDAAKARLKECEDFRESLQTNSMNLDSLKKAVVEKNLNKINEAFIIYENGVNKSKKILGNILNCDVSMLKEQTFKIEKIAETWIKDGFPDITSLEESLKLDIDLSKAENELSFSVSTVASRIDILGDLDDDTIKEITDFFKVETVIFLLAEDEWRLGRIPNAVVYEECKELLKENNIDFVIQEKENK